MKFRNPVDVAVHLLAEAFERFLLASERYEREDEEKGKRADPRRME